MKKFLSLLLCLVMLATMLASCSDGTDIEQKADRPNLTLKIAIIVDDNTTAEGITAMQNAFNAKASVDLSTKLEFVCFKESEYKTKMHEEMERLSGAGALGGGAANMGAAVDADGYPVASETQFDLVLITGEDMYKEYAANGWIISLNDHLNGTYKKLNTTVIDRAMAYVRAADPNLASDATTPGACYAIPAATTYGKYTYLALNKAALTKYNIPVPADADFTYAYQLFGTIMSEGTGSDMQFWFDKYEAEGKTFAPVYNTPETFRLPGVKYLSHNGEFSLMGTYFAPDMTLNEWSAEYLKSGGAAFSMNLLDSKEYRSYLAVTFEATKNEGYFGTEKEEEFIVGIVQGDYSLRNDEDYHYIVLENPIMQKSEVFDTMLAVSAFTVDKNRSVEILQELMTNDTGNDLLNIALFGLENENYYLEDGVVRLRNSYTYAAHPSYLFGNVVKTTYPCLNYGQSAGEYDGYVNQHNSLTTSFFDETYSESFYNFDIPDEWKEWKEGDPMPEGTAAQLANFNRYLAWQKADAYTKTVYDDLLASSDINDFMLKLSAYSAAMTDPTSADENVQNFLAVRGAADSYDFVGGDDTTVAGSFANYINGKVNSPS